MQKNAKHFAERLNHCLEDNGAPPQIRERSIILSKMLDISKHQAWNFLNGLELPNQDLLEKIAKEFEVETTWLSGER